MPRVKVVKKINEIDLIESKLQFRVGDDNFVPSKSRSRRIKIFAVGSNFTHWFADKIEASAPKRTLSRFLVTATTLDNAIINSLGGSSRAITRLQDVWALLQLQPKGEPGDLITNSYANIFYIGNNKDEICAAFVYWAYGGWNVDAYSAEDKSQWLSGNQVFAYVEN